MAASFGHHEVVRMLLSFGADPNFQDEVRTKSCFDFQAYRPSNITKMHQISTFLKYLLLNFRIYQLYIVPLQLFLIFI